MPNVSPKPFAQCQQEFAEECRRLAADAFGHNFRNGLPVYLAGSRRAGLDTLNPRAEIWASLQIATEEDSHLQTVRPEPLPRNLTIDQLAAVIRDWLRTEPLWIFAD
jgi:hypothetical protein